MINWCTSSLLHRSICTMRFGWLHIWWRHQMETYSALLALCAENSAHKGQWRGALMSSLISAWLNDWVENRDAGDSRRHRAHYDVTVKFWSLSYRCHSNYIYAYIIMTCQWESIVMVSNLQRHSCHRIPSINQDFVINDCWKLQIFQCRYN